MPISSRSTSCQTPQKIKNSDARSPGGRSPLKKAKRLRCRPLSGAAIDGEGNRSDEGSKADNGHRSDGIGDGFTEDVNDVTFDDDDVKRREETLVKITSSIGRQ